MKKVTIKIAINEVTSEASYVGSSQAQAKTKHTPVKTMNFYLNGLTSELEDSIAKEVTKALRKLYP